MKLSILTITIIIIFSYNLFAQKTIDYKYDALNRLTEVLYGNKDKITFTYDELGNRLMQSIISGLNDPDTIKNDMGRIFPNPAKDYVNIEFISEKYRNVEISIYTIEGKHIYQQKEGNIANQKVSINISGLANGIYFIMVTTGKQIIAQEKIIVSK